MTKRGEWSVTRLAASAVLMAALLAGGAVSTRSVAVAQEASGSACLAGVTAGERIDAIVSVLAGNTGVVGILDDEAAALAAEPGLLISRCPVVGSFALIDAEGIIRLIPLTSAEIWTSYLAGQSLAGIAADQGVDRATLLTWVQDDYANALGRARNSGVLTQDLHIQLTDHVLPQFGWLIDYVQGGPLLATSDDAASNSAEALLRGVPGEDNQTRTDNLIRLLVGVTLDDGGAWATLAGTSNEGKIWSVVGPVLTDEIAVALATADGSVLDEIYASHQSGLSLTEIHGERNAGGEALAERLVSRARASIADAAAAGEIDSASVEAVSAAVEQLVVLASAHRFGNPLPNDFLSQSFRGGETVIRSETGSFPTCQGVPATIWTPIETIPVDQWVDFEFRGTNGDDVIVGTDSYDVIDARGGNDLICAGEGSDDIDGGPGDDVIYGEVGVDIISGGQGRDKIYGGSDEDYLGGDSWCVYRYGPINPGYADEIHGGEGDDYLCGQGGADDLYGDLGHDQLDGGDGNDDLFGGPGNDFLDGGGGTDDCTGGPGDNTFSRC